MGEQKKRHLSRQSRIKSMEGVPEIKELVKSIVKANKAKLEEPEGKDEPLDCYTQEMKMRWHLDVKAFSKRLLQGYEVLLEQLSGGNASKKG